MVIRNRILSITVALALAASAALASSPQTSATPKNKTEQKTKDHVLRGSVVAVTDEVLTVRSGKKDTVFKMDSSTQKPGALGPGSEISVTYRDAGTQHIASNIELSAVAKAPAAPSKTRK